jgi:hypothetical protein
MKKDNQQQNPPRKVEIAAEPLWTPTWAWHLKTLATIYVVLSILYFAISHFLSRVPKPYRMREVPQEITPWIKK